MVGGGGGPLDRLSCSGVLAQSGSVSSDSPVSSSSCSACVEVDCCRTSFVCSFRFVLACFFRLAFCFFTRGVIMFAVIVSCSCSSMTARVSPCRCLSRFHAPLHVSSLMSVASVVHTVPFREECSSCCWNDGSCCNDGCCSTLHARSCLMFVRDRAKFLEM